MPHRPLSFFERNVERFALAAAGTLAVVALMMYGVRTSNRIMYEGRQVGPGELEPAIRHSAQQLQEAVEKANVREVDIREYHKLLRQRQAAGILCATTGSDTALPASLPRCVNFGPAIPVLEPLDPEVNIVLVRPHPPTRPLLTSGRSVVQCPADAPGGAAGVITVDQKRGGAETALSWVTVAGYFDVSAQQQALREAGYSRFRDGVWIVGTQAQRQERLPDGSYSAWRLIESPTALRAPAVPDPIFDPRTGLVRNRIELDEALGQLRHSQRRRMQPPFHPINAGADWQLPLPDAALTDPAGNGLLTQPGTGRAAVWFHDDTVEPGKTYRYRLRVNLWNCCAGRPKLLKHASQAWHSVVPGQWSDASAPIAVAPDRYFFVCGAQPRLHTVTAEVWKWHRGDWVRRRFPVGVGDVIGGVSEVKLRQVGDPQTCAHKIDFCTRAIVLDLSFDEELSVRMPALNAAPFSYRVTHSAGASIYDPLSGQLQQRWVALDRFDPLRRRLKDH